ncbi:MAG: tRNA uridine-5-carboxymethylaminomethyl(34) synthesis GTPase MnmE [Verrucomicrobia bacterium RIFCSPLOWO2_12_FULL_64_8]|nr:MAG: tRNA uridine-5-carboxymethylaminomethyl(34) synthesis GTPase MnmE [Verrucomicrobia bacterium RIFCSPLOWO2_12_FULL_64_8]
MSPTVDTIAAPATPTGTSALALVRASGPLAAELVRDIFGEAPLPRQAVRGDYRDRRTGAAIDDVMFTFFKEPNSYTGEDLLEISCHGNPFIVSKIITDLLGRGCRPAEPGEFTKRAFLNGRMELTQAEAVADLIHARSEQALLAANQQLRGALGFRMRQLIDDLLFVLARVEAYIDFPDEDLPPGDHTVLVEGIQRLLAGTGQLLATSHYGELLRAGVKTVIIGEPNVGKSSLLNRLIGRERAIVSSEPGTTRDYLEEPVLIGPYCLRLIDTAGLNPRPAPLEMLGITKTIELIAQADLILLVLDATLETSASPPPADTGGSPAKTIAVINKIDLAPRRPRPALPSALPSVEVSAIRGDGIDDLKALIVRHVESFRVEHGDELVIINARHNHALTQATVALQAAQKKLAEGAPAELLASDLRSALHAFGEISGKVDNEQMLDRLFATFCIGK